MMFSEGFRLESEMPISLRSNTYPEKVPTVLVSAQVELVMSLRPDSGGSLNSPDMSCGQHS